MGNLIKYKHAYWAVMLLAIVMPWGELTKFPIPGFRFPFGVSTFLGAFVVLYGITSKSIFRGLGRWKGGIALVVLVGYTLITAQFSYDKISGVFLSIKLLFYVFIAISFLQMPLTREDLVRLLRYIGLSGSIVMVLAVVDRVGIVSIPGFNLSLGNVKTGEVGVYVKDMCGPFANRSAFATYLSLYLPVVMGLSQIKSERFGMRLFSYFLVLLTLFVVFLTSSRGLFVGVFAVFGYFIYTTYGVEKVMKVFGALVALVLVCVVIAYFKPQEFEVFVSRFTSIFTSENQAEENVISVEFRNEAFRIAFTDLMRNPLGYGLGRVYFPTLFTFKNLHNSYLEFFYAGGLIGLVLLIYAFAPLIRGIFRPQDVELSKVFYASLLCIAVYNLTHSQWPFAMMWVYIGICLKFALPGPPYPHGPPRMRLPRRFPVRGNGFRMM